MSENYVDFNTFINVFNGNIVCETLRDSNLNASAREFVPRSIPEVSPEKPLPGNYGNNRRSKGNMSASASNRHNHHRINKRNDFWNKNRENASSNTTLHDKNQESAKVSGTKN